MFSNQVSYSDTIVYDVGDAFGVLTAGGVTESMSSVAGGNPVVFLGMFGKVFFTTVLFSAITAGIASCCVVRMLVSG